MGTSTPWSSMQSDDPEGIDRWLHNGAWLGTGGRCPCSLFAAVAFVLLAALYCCHLAQDTCSPEILAELYLLQLDCSSSNAHVDTRTLNNPSCHELGFA
eukprot:1951395-Amphidinium_carterae.1